MTAVVSATPRNTQRGVFGGTEKVFGGKMLNLKISLKKMLGNIDTISKSNGFCLKKEIMATEFQPVVVQFH